MNANVVEVVGSLIIAAFVAVGSEGKSQQTKQEQKIEDARIQMVAALPKEAVVGSALGLDLKVKNNGREKVEFSTRGPYVDFDLTLLDSKGKSVPLTRFGKHVYGDYRTFGGTAFLVTLAESEEYKVKLNVARVFDLSEPGEYTLTVRIAIGKAKLAVEKMKFKLTEER